MVVDFPHPICPIIYDHTKITSTQTLHYANAIHDNPQLNVHLETDAFITSLKTFLHRINRLGNRSLQKNYFNYNYTKE